MSDSPSAGELLAGFGGDVDKLTDYYCGQIDSDGEPTEYYDGGNFDAEHQLPGQRFIVKRRLVLFDRVFPEWVSEVFLFAVAILRTDIPMPGQTMYMTMGPATTRTETTTTMTMTMTTSTLIPPSYL
jgi:hypothetical protein